MCVCARARAHFGLGEVCSLGHTQRRRRRRQRSWAITHDNLSACHGLTRRHGWTGRAALCLMFRCGNVILGTRTPGKLHVWTGPPGSRSPGPSPAQTGRSRFWYHLSLRIRKSLTHCLSGGRRDKWTDRGTGEGGAVGLPRPLPSAPVSLVYIC